MTQLLKLPMDLQPRENWSAMTLEGRRIEICATRSPGGTNGVMVRLPQNTSVAVEFW